MSGGRRKYWSESGGELGRGSGERGGNGGEEGGGGELKEVGEGQRGCALTVPGGLRRWSTVTVVYGDGGLRRWSTEASRVAVREPAGLR